MSKFLETSMKIAGDFLQTAVFIDDKLDGEKQDAVVLAEEIKIPSGYNATETKKEQQLPEGQPPEANPSGCNVSDNSNMNVTKESDDSVNEQNIVRSFMEKGIICSVIKYSQDVSVDNYIKFIKKADIAVLDWDLYGDDGKTILDIINKLTAKKDNSLNELRLIVIYTYQDLEAVKNSILLLGLSFSEANPVNEFILHNKYTTISLFSKPHGINGVPERKIDPLNIADKCIEEFTAAFAGVVPNVALAAVSEIRKNTHRLLGVLNKDLDIGYLSHRALLPSPEDAEKHLEDIIADEIRSIISGNETGKNSSYEKICDYSEISDKVYKCIDDFAICFPLFIASGAENILCNAQKEILKEQHKNCFTKEWYGSEDESKNSEKLFAVVSSMQTDYSENIRKFLKLGVIIERINTEPVRYLCIQPECDSVRLDKNEKTEFMFLKLKLKKFGENFDLIFDDGSRYEVNYGRKNRKTILFKTSGNEIVEPQNDGEFIDVSNNKYKYICSLKTSHAQKIANEFGAYISRVGLNESEYLRRNRSKRQG
ncbi:MAG: response regulator receiver domain [Deltaproteobacteria bacterium]|jgi:hypothetical protein|nr:response regulator receiver domain [Deltaproteobacteria bacterium]